MMDYLRAVGPVAPQLVSGVADLIAKNQDWPEAQEFATRIAKLVAQMHPGIMSPDIKDVTPEVQALMMGMQSQLQQSQQQIQALTKALTDVEADRAQRDRKMELDFEAKILGVMQKADANYNTHIGAQLKELGEAVGMLHQALTVPPGEARQ
jgi:Skp family chaperone for outer membrane proteins